MSLSIAFHYLYLSISYPALSHYLSSRLLLSVISLSLCCSLVSIAFLLLFTHYDYQSILLPLSICLSVALALFLYLSITFLLLLTHSVSISQCCYGCLLSKCTSVYRTVVLSDLSLTSSITHTLTVCLSVCPSYMCLLKGQCFKPG